MNKKALDGFSGFAVHAGVVARKGCAIALPAPSGAGKSTLVAAALGSGFDYVSDEALCVNFGSHEVVPYPRPLAASSWSLRAAGLDPSQGEELGDDEFVFGPDRIGGFLAAPPLELGHVVGMIRRPGPPALVGVAPSNAMAWLLERSFNHYKRPAESFELAAALARKARAWRLEFSDPLEAAALLSARLTPV